jgi:PAS domain-containing protein
MNPSNATTFKRLSEVGAELDRLEEVRDLALAESNCGYWDWNIADNTLWWSSRMFRIYGIKPGSIATNSDWKALVNKDDFEELAEAVRLCIKDNRRYFFRFRINPADGSEQRVVTGVGNVIRDAAGIAIRMVGLNILEPIDSRFLPPKTKSLTRSGCDRVDCPRRARGQA